VLQLAEAGIRVAYGGSRCVEQASVGGTDFEQQLQCSQSAIVLRLKDCADARCIQQLDRSRQAVAAARCAHLDSLGAQAGDGFCHRRTARSQVLGKLLAGVRPTVRQPHEQRRWV
jgi:hypothetical protein